MESRTSANSLLRRRAGVLCATFLFMLTAVPLFDFGISEPASAATDRPHLVGDVPLYVPPDNPGAGGMPSSFVIDSARRRGYQLLSMEGSDPTTHVTSFDLDTRQLLRTVTQPGRLRAVGPHVVDEASGRVFFEEVGLPFSRIAVLDEVLFESGHPEPISYLRVPVRSDYLLPPVGMRFEPKLGKLLLAFSPQRMLEIVPRALPTYVNSVAQWDPTATVGGIVKEDWWYPIRGCMSSPVPLFVPNADAFLSKKADEIYAPCGFGDGGMQVMRLVLDPATGAPTAESALGSAPVVQRYLVDAASERTHIGVSSGSSYVVGYDGVRRRLVGTSTISNNTLVSNMASGVNPATGRLYFVIPPRTQQGAVHERGGLAIVEGRQESLPQALIYREFAFDLKSTSIHVDRGGPEGTSQLFVLVERAGKRLLAVVRDPIAVGGTVSAPPEPTSDVNEAAGKTERSYAGEASGYGTRYLIVGGAVRHGIVQFGMANNCLERGREIVAGQVNRSALSSISVAGQAHALAADADTKADFRDASQCWPVAFLRPEGGGGFPAPPPPDAIRGVPVPGGWSDSGAECSGEEKAEASVGGGAAKLECGHKAERSTASAHYSTLDAGVVTVGHSSSRTELRRDDKLGLVVDAVSVAEDVRIDLGGGSAVTFGSVRSVATAQSRGRPTGQDYKRATRLVTFCGIKAPGIDDRGCRNETEMASLVDRLNLLNSRLVFRQPAVDPDLYAGTPKGYLAGVQRDRNDVTLTKIEIGDDLPAVPALEVQVRQADQPRVNRYIVQLAGVRAIAAYGVFALPPEAGPFDPPPPDVVPDGAELVEPLPAFGDAAPQSSVSAAAALDVPAPSKAVSAVTRAIRRMAKAAAVAGGIFFRGPFDSLVLFGIWSTFGLPLYLLARRRRLTVSP